MGKFISRDPIGIADDVNLYSYVGNSPMMFVDRFGKAAKAFVKAYDNYLNTQASLAGINSQLQEIEELRNKSYYTSNAQTEWVYNFLSSLQEKTMSDLIIKEDFARKLHYQRNDYNIHGLFSINDAIKKEWRPVIADYHQYQVPDGEKNIKYVSLDGHQEVIFSYLDGSVDTSIENIGTYNFYAPEFNIDGGLHMIYDVGPYKKWGNGIGDMHYKNY